MTTPKMPDLFPKQANENRIGAAPAKPKRPRIGPAPTRYGNSTSKPDAPSSAPAAAAAPPEEDASIYVTRDGETYGLRFDTPSESFLFELDRTLAAQLLSDLLRTFQ